MTAEVKLRTLAKQSTDLVSFLGSGPFRMFDRQLPPGYIERGTCIRLTRISTVRYFSKETSAASSVNELTAIRFQIDVLDYDPERARSAASAICDWLVEDVDLSSDAQFSSPPTTPKRHPAFVLNQRAGLEPETDPPIYSEVLDVRIFNKE